MDTRLAGEHEGRERNHRVAPLLSAQRVGVSRPYPDPQPRFAHPPAPGKREDGKPWYDGPTKSAHKAEKAELAQIATDEMAQEKIKFTGEKIKPRDFRRGDCWLTWHFKPQTENPDAGTEPKKR